MISVASQKGTETASVPSAKGTENDDRKALKQFQCDNKTSRDSFHTHSLPDAHARVCEIYDLDLDDWQKRVVEHFIAPLERSLQVRSKHGGAMADLVSDLAGYSSATLKAAAVKLRRERSVFPSIAQAVATCAQVNPAVYRPAVLVKNGKAWTAWRAHLERQGETASVAFMERRAESTVDANLLDDLLALKTLSSDQPTHGPPQHVSGAHPP